MYSELSPVDKRVEYTSCHNDVMQEKPDEKKQKNRRDKEKATKNGLRIESDEEEAQRP